MSKPVALDAAGNELRRSGTDDDGELIPDHVLNKAGIMGAYWLLDRIARRDDNPEFRRAARLQADALKDIARRATGNADIIDQVQREVKLIETAKRLPPKKPDPLVIDL